MKQIRIKKTYWIARDKSTGNVYAYLSIPLRSYTGNFMPDGFSDSMYRIPNEYAHIFKDLTYENSPMRIDIFDDDDSKNFEELYGKDFYALQYKGYKNYVYITNNKDKAMKAESAFGSMIELKQVSVDAAKFIIAQELSSNVKLYKKK